MSPRLRPWIRFGVSAGILAILLRFIPAQELVASFRRVPRGIVLLGIVVVVTGHVASALKWRLLQGSSSTRPPIRAALRAHFYGVLANLWLPSLAGGDLIRAGLMFKESGRPAIVAVASLVDRLADTVALVSLAFAGLLLAGTPTENGWRVLGLVLSALAVFGVLLFVAYRYLRSRPQHHRLSAVADAVQLMARHPMRVLVALTTSLAVQTAFVLVAASFGRALGMQAPLRAWLMAWPLAKLAAVVPISAAGIGVREAALVMLMRPFGDSAGLVMAAGLLWQGMLVAAGVLGYVLFSVVPALVKRVSPLDGVVLGTAVAGKE
jgi:glycosyltransferase 2 family protein